MNGKLARCRANGEHLDWLQGQESLRVPKRSLRWQNKAAFWPVEGSPRPHVVSKSHLCCNPQRRLTCFA